METGTDLKRILKEFMAPIIDECIEKSLSKHLPLFFPKQQSTPEIMDIKAISNYIKLTRSTVYGLTSRRIIPHYKQGKRLYFCKDEVDERISKGKIKTKEEIEMEANSFILN